MAETRKKPGPKPKAEKTEEEQFEEDLEVLDPVNKAVKRTLKHPESGEEREFIQTELAFIPKTRFFRLFSTTVRLASEQEAGGVGLFVADALNAVQGEGLESVEFIDTILKLVELVPDFIEEAFLLMLNVKPEDHMWVRECIEVIDDETATDIIDVFVAQNSKAVRNFFTKHLAKVAKRFNQEVVSPLQTNEE